MLLSPPDDPDPVPVVAVWRLDYEQVLRRVRGEDGGGQGLAVAREHEGDLEKIVFKYAKVAQENSFYLRQSRPVIER